ncbi:MAG: threonylcarbamoyl-AMP synthase [Rhodospirillum sp.]|nr:threonylcarbamoyl-AMP synthase [Rhodospirillum sp.]MCF8489032.1 threonylcarbamoyl-AMP synthase [Rhodospirillum sp.]MCF8499779.1 threonylcarbamoyl-AMP synthase [Rhodospirillum sp.]
MADSVKRPRIENVVACLREGGVVLVPTDTVYGLAVSPDHPDAVERLFALKRRPFHRNLPVMVADLDALAPLGLERTAAMDRLAASPFVPGALTLAVGFSGAPRPAWLMGRDEVAFRIPNHPFLLDLLRVMGPLLVTSANGHGLVTPERVDNILPQLSGAPDLVIDGGKLSGDPSTLVNCRVDPPRVEREGVIPEKTIRELLA